MQNILQIDLFMNCSWGQKGFWDQSGAWGGGIRVLPRSRTETAPVREQRGR